MTRRERLVRKAELRHQWAESRARKSDQSYVASNQAVAGIEPGQPILIGHHSERGHRRAFERAHQAMEKCVEHTKMAELHEQKAAGLEHQLENTIFSDDENAIEALQAKVFDLESRRERIKTLNKLIRKEVKAGLPDGWLDRIGATQAEKAEILSNVKCWGSPLFQPYKSTNLSGRIRQAKQRIASIQSRELAQKAAADAGGIVVNQMGYNDYCTVVFAEKPERSVLNDLKTAGYSWGGGKWMGKYADLPESVNNLATKPV